MLLMVWGIMSRNAMWWWCILILEQQHNNNDCGVTLVVLVES